jgi:hypothetical protein
MVVLKQLNTAADFWLEIVVPDCSDYFAAETNLRRALHAYISLFHMSAFTFTDCNSTVRPVSKSSEFATALEQQNADFGRIRGIANAAKHLELTDIRPVPNAPSHAANTAIQTEFVGAGGYGCVGGYNLGGVAYGASPKVMLAGPNGSDMEFSNILRSVYRMWETLKCTYGW